MTLKNLFFSLTALMSLAGQANFGPWPHSYFMKGGVLSCSEGKPCFAPRMDDVATLKSDWDNHEEERLSRVVRLEDLARVAAEEILEIAQKELIEDEESSFGELYLEYGSRLLNNISKKKIESMRLWVSKASPMYLKIHELEGKLFEWKNQIDQQEDPDLKEGLELLRNEKYKEWLANEEFQETLSMMAKIQEEVFPKSSLSETVESDIVDGLMNLEVDLGELVTFKDCPKKVEDPVKGMLGKVQFSKTHREKLDWDPIKDKNFIRFILKGNGFGRSLTVRCDKANSLLGKVKVSYDKGHQLKVDYRSKEDQDGITQYKIPTRSEILSALK